MPDPNAFTRRQFLYSGLAMVSTVTTVPTFLSRSSLTLADTSMRLKSKSGVPEDRVLVVVQLSGGNDGLNTIVPFGSDAYYRARPGIAVAERDVIKLDTDQGIGLHPNMTDLHEMIDEGIAAIVQGVGYPNPNRSHFASMDVWHCGDTRGGRGHGWIGKALDQSRADDQSLDCICMGSQAPLAAQGKRVKPVTFEQAELFRWAGHDLHPALGDAYDRIQHPTAGLSVGPANDGRSDDPAAFIFRTAMDAQVASRRIREAVARRSETRFGRDPLSRQLETVAAMIRAELPTRVYYVAQGGFDTHAAQRDTHARLLGNFSSAVAAFYRELATTGHRGRVITLAFSEFGRRVRQNASGGTDHGAAGPVFLFGEHLRNPGLIGTHPSLSDLNSGDLIHRTDFRSIYTDLLERWMKMDSEAALGRQFKSAGLLRA